jgi:hypothetical protein
VPPITVGLNDATSIAAAKARRLAELREAGETREVHFGVSPDDSLAVIVTGVPRTGRDKLPDDYVSWKPRGTPYFPPAPKTEAASLEPIARAPGERAAAGVGDSRAPLGKELRNDCGRNLDSRGRRHPRSRYGRQVVHRKTRAQRRS